MTGSCIGVDYGLRRTGFAVGDTEHRLAMAHGTHVEGRDGSLLVAIRDLAAARGADTVVLGLPLTADGREGDMVARVRRFAAVIERDTELRVVLWDERFSSAEADRWLALRKAPGKEERDAVAAAIILQSWLDSPLSSSSGSKS
ncbi:Holliday junction resolvase RuvX [bacterium]|nr:MAG: Holliday junction resolvase RuvX [bacterium]